jgi:hypothetical protein
MSRKISAGQDSREFEVEGKLVDSELVIRAGCQTLRLSEAIEHWELNEEMLLKVAYVANEAARRGWIDANAVAALLGDKNFPRPKITRNNVDTERKRYFACHLNENGEPYDAAPLLSESTLSEAEAYVVAQARDFFYDATAIAIVQVVSTLKAPQDEDEEGDGNDEDVSF